MGTIEGRYFKATGLVCSKLLCDFFQYLASATAVSLDGEHGRQIITSDRIEPARADTLVCSVKTAKGACDIRPIDLGASDLAVLLTQVPDLDMSDGTASWSAFQCRFENGVTDIIALRDLGDPADAATFLARAWPGLRQACVDACGQSGPDLSDDAMLWMISQKVNAAILVLDDQCRVMRRNAAAEDILADGNLLLDTPQGLVCAGNKETAALKKAVAESYGADEGDGVEYILILRGKSGTAHVPLSLSTYTQVETGKRLILAMMPRPPAHERIEELAKSMGLTPSEARVAALIREGHSNREAAEIAGLKVETFNTYAKRALSKMNVKCRAEMAQMLTWQAALERS